MSSVPILTAGVPAGSAVAADPAGLPARTPDFSTVFIRRFAMFQALYADLARAHRKRRQQEFQRQLEQRAQHEVLMQLPRMLVR
jgi:hypothetical protein